MGGGAEGYGDLLDLGKMGGEEEGYGDVLDLGEVGGGEEGYRDLLDIGAVGGGEEGYSGLLDLGEVGGGEDGYSDKKQIRPLFIYSSKEVFRIKKTKIVDNIVWAKGVGKGEGRLESKGGQLIPSKGPEWKGIRHHEQDICLPGKWVFLLPF